MTQNIASRLNFYNLFFSTMLIKDLDSEGYEPPSRSRCRRLYDIGNF